MCTSLKKINPLSLSPSSHQLPNSTSGRSVISWPPPLFILEFCLALSFTGLVHKAIGTARSYVWLRLYHKPIVYSHFSIVICLCLLQSFSPMILGLGRRACHRDVHWGRSWRFSLLCSLLFFMASNPKKNPSPRHQIPSLQIIYQGGPRHTPQTTQAIANALDFPPELDDKTLLLKTQFVLIVRHREDKIYVTWKFPPCRLVFLVTEGDMQFVVGGNTSLVSGELTLSSIKLAFPERCTHWWNSGIKFMGVTNCLCIGCESCSRGKNVRPFTVN